MKKKKVLLWLSAVAVLGAIGAGLVLLLYHEPAFYRRGDQLTQEERLKLSDKFVGKAVELRNCVSEGSEKWAVEFTQDQLNSFFRAGFVKWQEDFESLSRRGITDPRIVFEPDRLLFGFRYGSGPWQTVISFDVRIWVVRNELNLLAIEFVGRHAGALPISAQSMLDALADQARRCNMEVNWYRHNGNPVALLRLQNDRSHPSFQLTGLKIEEGRLTIAGRSLEPGQQAMR